MLRAGAALFAGKIGFRFVSDSNYPLKKVAPLMAQRCSNPGCAAEGKFACSRCRSAFYCGELCQKAHWRAHKPGCAAAAAQGGGAGAGAASGGASSAAPTPSPYGKRFLYTGVEQVVEDPRCGACGKDLSHRGRGCKEQQMACGACRKVPYCDMECLESHYLEHMEECFKVIRARVAALDVHKDDSSGEYVLKDYVGECTRKHGALDERTLTGQQVYGTFLQKLGRLGEAKVILMAAYEGMCKTLTQWHQCTLSCVNSLAGLLSDLGEHAVAEKMYRQVLMAERHMQGPKHPATLTVMSNLAAMLQSQGKLNEQSPCYLKC